jgi:cyclopropane-fatty-acyl-phospholipid synthase
MFLQAAEERMLSLYLDRAQIPRDAAGLRILDLGCGWGSFSIFAAQKLPNCSFLMISNSAPQKIHIEARAAKLGLRNITVKTRNVATMQIDDEDRGAFDRIVSVEMMEHMKNYQLLLEKVSLFLKPDGLLFVHIFTHARASYHFETEGPDNWMGRYFFTGGTSNLRSFHQTNYKCTTTTLVFCVILVLFRHYAQPFSA